MLGTADVEIDRHPSPLDLGINQAIGITRIEKAEEIPTRSSPLRHRVGLAAIAFAVSLQPQPVVTGAAQRGFGCVARAKVDQFGESNGQFMVLNDADRPGWLSISVEFVEDRTWFTPKTLATEEPVAELVVDCWPTHASSLEIDGNSVDKRLRLESSVNS